MSLYYLIYRHITLPLLRRVIVCAPNRETAINKATPNIPDTFKLYHVAQ